MTKLGRVALPALAVVLLSLLLAGCGGGPASPPRATIMGRVLSNGDVPTPIVGAQVKVGSESIFTDSYGNFTATVSPGTYTITVTAMEHRPLRLTQGFSAGTMSLGDLQLTRMSLGSGALAVDRVTPDGAGPAQLAFPANSQDSLSLLLVFPQTDTSATYTYSVYGSFDSIVLAGAAPRYELTQRRSLPSPGTLRNAMRPLGFAPGQRNRSVDAEMRAREVEVQRRRNLRQTTRRMTRDVVGATGQFWSWRWDTKRYEKVTARCLAVGTHAAFYVDERLIFNTTEPLSQTWVDEWSAFFEANRDTLTAQFGTELDVDGSGNILVLVTKVPSDSADTVTMGYFDPENEYDPNSSPDHAYSNFSEMIYINPVNTTVEAYKTLAKATLAHEYQHLLHFSERYKAGGESETWLTEAFSTLAEDLVGYGYVNGDPGSQESVAEWLYAPYRWSLTQWDQEIYNYGGAYLFGRYLMDHYPNAILPINQSAAKGADAGTAPVIQKINAAYGTALSFGDLYRDWALAVVNQWLNRPPSDPYQHFSSLVGRLPGGPEAWILQYPYYQGEAATLALRPWGLDFIAIQGGGPGGQFSGWFTSAPAGNYGVAVVRP